MTVSGKIVNHSSLWVAQFSECPVMQFQANLQVMFSDSAFIMQQMLTTELLNSAWAE